ncbi:MAG: hypothetical protein II786_06960 [Muribaculaceae bacterium]|nr:hypothetical protein [Muribaculaceae bacterium]
MEYSCLPGSSVATWNPSSNVNSDVNGDGETGVADITMLVNLLLNQ